MKKIQDLESKIEWLEKVLKDREKLLVFAKKMLDEHKDIILGLTSEVKDQSYMLDKVKEVVRNGISQDSGLSQIKDLLEEDEYNIRYH